ncbi:MAG: hypothetical protein H7X77_05710, partial [Anaerolineae bacterium]|nr:hypothetical protein [Anaerolineae bacterium]
MTRQMLKHPAAVAISPAGTYKDRKISIFDEIKYINLSLYCLLLSNYFHNSGCNGMKGLTKITFIFTDEPDLAQVQRDERFSSSIEIPDTIIQLPDAHEKVIKIAELTGFFTEANLHISCPNLQLKNHPIKQNTTHMTRGYSLFDVVDVTCLYFEGYYGRGKLVKKKFQIYAPIRLPSR